MPAPIIRQLLPDNKNIRSIDNHYHLEMIADNGHQIIEYQAHSLRLQHEAARANLLVMAEIAGQQDQTNSQLSSILDGILTLNDSLDLLNATATETFDAICAQTEVLQAGFREMAQLMMQQQEVLQQIAYTLSSPYETQALELLREADLALKTGMKSAGRDQKAEYADSMRLLQDVLNNPIGSRNYVAWFQVGWLKWANAHDFAGAEEAFYQAARLSASSADLYHTNSLRHMAYMQYKQNNQQDAYNSIHKAMRILPGDYDIRYDAARYGAKTGRKAEALELLEKCIDQRPQTIVTMFSEEDFLQ